ncbi:argininosuccinate lyase [Candidatus Gottesmanbacteria bacterium RIFCSPLOWO2_01_FULL_48_11]|uniref:Argininosuccinate lyase n=3 Tax=Patescibacteria group TaxID=1783273 RepID=A0A0G1WGE1_9BACT|nr:MAG: Argininosuccinate lyase [Candidatus Gottesmanbacteria bacterium GW2011_GWA2_47_9]KKU89398.1 MAG: Argininosuccinate lyase [Candidatus Yanofskybacteria bacterium GW2011_GWA1_48_10]OGG27546.1 MAG: argininosuccinate lyase [Candidatus Gottesmanbacteria bacterium RIFCSPLOWO2_01_FULL_48_11]
MKPTSDVPFWKDAKDVGFGSVAIAYAGGEDVILDEQFVQYECEINAAWVVMLLKQKLIPQSVGKSLLEGLQTIKTQHSKGIYKLNPMLEDVHSNIEQALIAQYGIEVGGYMRLGIARNDQVYTDTRMWMRDHIVTVCEMVLGLIKVILEWSTHQTHTVMPGYTHLRVSQSITAAHWMSAKAFHFLDDVKQIANCYDIVNTCPLGIAEMAGTHLPIDRAYTAQLLGFAAPTPHSLYTANQRGEIEAKILFELSSLAMHIRRTMSELIIFTGQEFGLFELGRAYATGGTAQPNLVNPDAIEAVRATMAKIPALALETVMIIDTLPSGYIRDTQATKKTLFEAFAYMEKTIPVVAGVLSTLVPHKARMEELANTNFASAPDMTNQLSVCGKVSFRQAYHVVKAIIKSGAISSFAQLTPGLVRETAIEVLQKPIEVTQEQIDEVASARQCVMAHTSLGGPAPKQVKKMIKKIKKEVRNIAEKLNEKKQKLQQAKIMLATKVSDVTVAGKL